MKDDDQLSVRKNMLKVRKMMALLFHPKIPSWKLRLFRYDSYRFTLGTDDG